MDNSSKNKMIDYIDTSIMSDNIATALFDKNDIVNMSNLLESYSFAVQFAVKTHSNSLSNEEKQRFAELQNEAESKTRKIIVAIENRNKKQSQLIFKFGLGAGVLAGASSVLLIQYFW